MDKRIAIQNRRQRLLETAAQARRQGVNHRGFKVGAVGFAARTDQRTSEVMHATFAAANYKPLPRGGERFCAEERIIRAANRAGFTSLLAIAVAAKSQPDDHTGKHYPVLVPCKYCRHTFSSIIREGGVITPRTRFISMNIDTGIIGDFRIGHLLETLGTEPAVWDGNMAA